MLDLPFKAGQNLARQVSTGLYYFWHSEAELKPLTVIAYDFGIKYNAWQIINRMGMNVIVVPWNKSAEEVPEMNPGWILQVWPVS